MAGGKFQLPVFLAYRLPTSQTPNIQIPDFQTSHIHLSTSQSILISKEQSISENQLICPNKCLEIWAIKEMNHSALALLWEG